MEITFKIVLDKRRAKKNQTFPLKLRVYQEKKYKTYNVGIDLREEDWDDQLQEVRKINPGYKLHNVKIGSLKAKVQREIFMNEDSEKGISATDLVSRISNNKTDRKTDKPDNLAYGKSHVQRLINSGHIGNAIVYTSAINKLQAHGQADKLPFEAITYSFLEGFNSAMLSEGMKVNGISNYLRSIRALFNKAINEGIISADSYPFSKYKIRNEKTINRTLTSTEISGIINLDLPTNTSIWHHRNLFLLSFCLVGMNFSDLLTLSIENFTDGRVVFRRRKTHKVYSILIHPKAAEIFKLYHDPARETGKSFVLPFVQNKNNPSILKKDILQAIKNTNDHLRKMSELLKLGKPVTTYYARYSWANTARSLGFSKDLIAEALGHDYGNKVTGIYLDNYSNSVIDDMNKKVIESVFTQPGGDN